MQMRPGIESIKVNKTREQESLRPPAPFFPMDFCIFQPSDSVVPSFKKTGGRERPTNPTAGKLPDTHPLADSTQAIRWISTSRKPSCLSSMAEIFIAGVTGVILDVITVVAWTISWA